MKFTKEEIEFLKSLVGSLQFKMEQVDSHLMAISILKKLTLPEDNVKDFPRQMVGSVKKSVEQPVEK